MFYSHEILTSREHGVATVWLVATLGAKSTTKKVNRKAILDVDVPKACETIIHPEAPMALRLQGNLLYGVSRVYHQQCGYALMDAQTMRDRMRAMLKEIRSTGLDPDAGKAKPSQLVLPDDPSFIPNLMLPGLNVDLSTFDISSEIETSHKSSLLSSFLAPSSKSSHLSDGQLRLNISSSDIGGLGAGAPGFLSEIDSSASKENQFELPAAFAEETGVLLQPDFEFDGDGNIIELPVRPASQDKLTASSRRSAAKVNSGLRPDKEGEFQALQDQFEDQMVLHDDVEMGGNGRYGKFGSGDLISGLDSGADPNYESVIEASFEAPEAQQRLRKRSVKTLGFDDPPELRNSDLAQWNSEYAQNMALAAKLKQTNRLITLAKKNAASWVMGERICCVDFGLDVSGFEHPLDMFTGEKMLATLTGTKIRTTRKRSRDVERNVVPEDEARNVRMRGDGEDERGRGDAIEHDNGYGIGFDLQDIEVGRHVPPPIYDDGSSQMPWNITASIRGSQPGSSVHSRQFLSSVGAYSSIGGPDGSVLGGASRFGRRMGRMTSASPLAGRGMICPGMSDIPITDNEELNMRTNLGSNMDFDSSVVELGDDDTGNHNRHHNSFEIYGPAAAVDTQTAAESQWLVTTLDRESANFLEFVKSKIGEGGNNVKGLAEGGTEGGGYIYDATATVEVSFSTLLPPVVNSCIVATQALLHTLTLATNGALHVRQEKGTRYTGGREEFGEIFMCLA